jgi:hypothetical protein
MIQIHHQMMTMTVRGLPAAIAILEAVGVEAIPVEVAPVANGKLFLLKNRNK